MAQRTTQHESVTSEAASLAEVVGRCQATRRCSSSQPRSNCRENAIVETARCEMRCDFDVKQLELPVWLTSTALYGSGEEYQI